MNIFWECSCFYFLFSVCVIFGAFGQDGNFANYFAGCHKNNSNFDSCIKDALNDIRPFFKTGVPELNIPPFDPFFAQEVPQTRSGYVMNYKLKLKNVRESGWSVSQVIWFRSDFDNNLIQYTQTFPDKVLAGDYEFIGKVFGSNVATKGKFKLNLYDLVQTTTISRRPIKMPNGTMNYKTPLKVDVNVQTIKNLNLHISNLLGGRSILESFLDRMINSAWQPGFEIIRPLINDLVSTAFTKIFNDAFQDFDFSTIIK